MTAESNAREVVEAVDHTVRGYELLRAGDFRRGWAEFEWRWRTPLMKRPSFIQPQWRGGSLGGSSGGSLKDKTILLIHEQGFGDTIQFIRYADVLARRGATVVASVPPKLASLMRCVQGVADVVFTQPSPRPFDTWANVMSLPLACGTRSIKEIPAKVPYITPPSGSVGTWKQRIAELAGAAGAPPFRVGLCWAGRPTHKDDANRSIPLAQFAALAETPAAQKMTFYSLQVGETANGVPGSSLGVLDLAARFVDFADTAAAIKNLDLVITVDTAVAHLAGAMDTPVWTLLPHVADWRWLVGREDSPWYPTMRLFRQQQAGDWRPVIQRAADELRKLIPR